MNSLFEKIKTIYIEGTSLMQLIYINIGVFIIINLTIGLLALFNIHSSIIVTYLELPSNLNILLYRPWTLITYMFLHIDFSHIFFNMLALYWFGRIALEYYSQKQLVAIYLLGGLSGAALYLLSYNIFPYFETLVKTSVLYGASGAVLAICTAAATIRPNYPIRLMFIGEIKLVWLAIGMIIISLCGILGDNAGGEFAHLGGALFGYIYAKAWMKGNDFSKPITKVINWIANLFKKRPKIKIKGTKYNTAHTFKTDAEYNKEKRANNEAIDKILDKIKHKGYESLTAEEKRELFDRSRNNY